MVDSMYVKEEIEISDLDNMLWSGAKDHWNHATDSQRETVWCRLLDIFVLNEVDGRIPTKTEINDFIWFDCDDIFDDDEDDE